MVKGYIDIEFIFSPRRGWTALPKPVNTSAPASVRRARESSLAVKGVTLFNLCPRGLRDMASDHHDSFKENLDSCLFEISDQPTIAGCLLDQVPMLMQQFENR